MREPISKVENRDCLEAMREMPSSSVSHVITSPPYNLGEGMEDKGGFHVAHKGSKWSKQTAGAGWAIGYKTWKDNLPYAEYVEWQKDVLKECWRLIDDAGAIFYNHKPRTVNGILRHPLSLIGDLPVRQEIVWNRKSGFNASTTFFCPMSERIILIAKPNFKLKNKAVSMLGDVWTITPEINTPHPAPFPYELPQRILSSVANINKPILDPFSGSGTTRIAAFDYGYDFIGCEIDKSYCEMSNDRFERHKAQPKLFEPVAETFTQEVLF